MPYRVLAALPPRKSIVLHPRRTPTTGMLAFAGSVFAFFAVVGALRSLYEPIHASLLGLGALVAAYFAWYGLAACFQRLHVTVSASDDVMLLWPRSSWTNKRQSFPLTAVRDVRVKKYAGGTSLVVIELALPHARISLDALATVDDLEPLAATLRSFLLSG